ncbi:serine/threonine-protein phosphatase 6 regulatory subunit 1-like [Salvia divinorum]|uniref:Serine/threonine-protein phosphatase 6 regulatory subunit 1-like n=1 Tax=Salvia divinorum TaxID=28513 RepID=A0ABD1I1F9_SALDI
MFWHMAGLSTASPVETILDKDNFTLDELLDEDEIIQECKALNGRLISYLRERSQVKQLVHYIVQEAPDGASKERILKFPFVACEIFTCEVVIILKALVDDEELMDLLFSFLDPEHSHSSQLAGYFSKVVVCLLLRKTAPLMNYIRDHQDIIKKLVDLIGITSIMEVLIHFIGADEHIYANCGDTMQWLEEMDILDMIVDKFSSSDCPEVHANAAETLCTITRWAPPSLAAKISSPSFIGRLFHHALEESRPKTVLVNLLLVCISLLDPKRLTSGIYYMYNRQTSHGPGATADPETIKSMLESLGDLLKLLDVSSEEHNLLTTYGKLQPPLGKRRLKIIEFISVLVAVSSEAAEKELIRLDAMERILQLFFQYPYNNFLHHHVEHIVISCLESKNHQFVGHLIHECNLVGKILDAEKNFMLSADASKPTVAADGKLPPRIGNIGFLSRIANKLIQLGNNDCEVLKLLQENSEWVDWQSNVLLKRNILENVFQWACGRPTTLQDRTRYSDDDYQDRDYDVAALANNLSQAFKYGIYSNDAINEGHSSLEGDDEDVYFDDESAEVVVSSLRLSDDQDSGGGLLFTNSNWFAFEDERIDNEHSAGPDASSSPDAEEHLDVDGRADGDVDEKDEANDAISKPPGSKLTLESDVPETIGSDKTSEWVEWRESSDSLELPVTSADTLEMAASTPIPNGESLECEAKSDDVEPDSAETTNAKGGTKLPQSADVDEGSRRIEEGEEGSSKG